MVETKQDPRITEAEAKLRTAVAAFDAVQARLLEAAAEASRLEEAVGKTDPDAKTFDEAVRRHEAAAARYGALRDRKRAALEAVETAQAAIDTARETVQKERIDAMRDEAARLDAEISTETREFLRLLGPKIRALNALVSSIPRRVDTLGFNLGANDYRWAGAHAANPHRHIAGLGEIG